MGKVRPVLACFFQLFGSGLPCGGAVEEYIAKDIIVGIWLLRDPEGQNQ